MIIHFELRQKEDVLRLNQIATQYSFDIWVHSDEQMFDAKTLLALYTLPFNRMLKLVVEDHVNAKRLMEDMRYFLDR